jgi:hypothetical protein
MKTKYELLGGTRLGWEDPRPEDVPFVQITLSKEGEPDRHLTLSPRGFVDHFVSHVMEHARQQPIDEATFARLARALNIDVTDQFRQQICEIVIGTTMAALQKWHGPRALLNLLKQLKRDGLQTVLNTQDDKFAQFVINTIQHQASKSNLPVRKAINCHIEAIREVIKPGRPDQETRTDFMLGIVELALKHGDRLALPTRDRDRALRSTPLYEFAATMCDLVVDYGNALCDRRGLPHGRFTGFELGPEELIGHLEKARSVILRENSNTYT